MITAAAVTKSVAEMISAMRVPNRKASACPINDPNRATPSTLPICRVELSTPAAAPERAFSTLPRSVEVSGGTNRPSPPPIAKSCPQIETTRRRDQRAERDDSWCADPFGLLGLERGTPYWASLA